LIIIYRRQRSRLVAAPPQQVVDGKVRIRYQMTKAQEKRPLDSSKSLGQRIKGWMPRWFFLLYVAALLFLPDRAGDSCCFAPPQSVPTIARGEAIDGSSSASAGDGDSSTPAPSAQEYSAQPREGFHAVSFSQLSSTELELDDRGLCLDVRVPQAVEALHGKSVAVAGFVIPTTMEGSQMTEFLLVPNQLACCFGQFLQVNEWIEIKAERPLDCLTESPVTVYGVLHVSPQRVGSAVSNVYQMDAQLLSKNT
jgi:hypothetical protein